jgi:hypothetical protein
MKKLILFLGFLFMFVLTEAQELFTYTEPASNMAARTFALRMTSTFMPERPSAVVNTHFNPEIMVGISKRWMFHLDAFVSNRAGEWDAEGGSIYIKRRFYSVDNVHSHFRMAAIGRFSFNNSDIHQEAVDLNGHNSGLEFGLIATQLLHKVALSGSVSYIQGTENVGEKFYTNNVKLNRRALGFTFSTGKLFLPKSYRDYNQLNVNGMVEWIGQTNLNSGNTFLDVAPVLQFIIKSRMRLDLGYRIPISNQLARTAPGGGLIRFEYNFFNAF